MLEEIMVEFEKEVVLKDWGDDGGIDAFIDFMFKKYEEYKKTIDNSEKIWYYSSVKRKEVLKMNAYELIEMLSNLTDEEKEMPIAYDDMDMGYFAIFTYKIENGYIVLKNM